MKTLQQQTQHLGVSQGGYTVAEIVESTKRFLDAFPTAEEFAQRLARSVAVRSL
jgi:hypothetical protein